MLYFPKMRDQNLSNLMRFSVVLSAISDTGKRYYTKSFLWNFLTSLNIAKLSALIAYVNCDVQISWQRDCMWNDVFQEETYPSEPPYELLKIWMSNIRGEEFYCSLEILLVVTEWLLPFWNQTKRTKLNDFK